MTTTAFTPEQKLTVIKHLAGGKPAPVVATIMKCSPEDVIDLARHHGYPDPEKLAWAADIMAKNLEQDAAAALPAGTPTPATTRPTPVAATPPATGQPLTRPDEIRVLLNTAKAHPSKRIQAAADRAFDALDRVRTMVTEYEQKNAEKIRRDAERKAARAEVERLEAQLAAAKAKLRSKPAASEQQDPADGEFPCDDCDRTFPTAQGRALHATRTHREAAAS